MQVEEFKAKLQAVEKQGFVVSKRRGNTGIGYTLETLLGIGENNITLPDLGEIELKSKRKNVSTFVTMFTFNSGAWKISQAETIARYGYDDKKSRRALKCFVSVSPNAQGLFLKAEAESLKLFHTDGTLIAEWLADALAEYFSRKLPSMILVLADTRLNSDGKEEFYYNEAYLLSEPSADGLLSLIEKRLLMVDLRMHLNPNGSVRNRGTAFRMDEKNLTQCFTQKEKLL
ncbi:MAG: MvaI/BcnI family restriction endonuclease [Saprospiraceae bacterium]